jgi:dTDP-4-dehydrorhamnose reductase
MRAIIVGMDGFIGQALDAELVSRGHQSFGTTRRRESVVPGKSAYLDLAAGPWQIAPESADVAFICAAMTNIAECRRSPEQARLVNTVGPINVARALLEKGITPIYLSTNAVFDCQEPLMAIDRPKKPSSLYGALKSEAEDAILRLSSKAVVVRLTKVLAVSGLLSGWWRTLNADRPVEAARDHRMAPISREHTVASLIGIADRAIGGVYQLSASSDVSYVDLAYRMAERAGRGRHLVSAKAATELGIPANEVMHYTSLDARRASELTGIATPGPFTAIDQTIEELAAS